MRTMALTLDKVDFDKIYLTPNPKDSSVKDIYYQGKALGLTIYNVVITDNAENKGFTIAPKDQDLFNQFCQNLDKRIAELVNVNSSTSFGYTGPSSGLQQFRVKLGMFSRVILLNVEDTSQSPWLIKNERREYVLDNFTVPYSRLVKLSFKISSIVQSKKSSAFFYTNWADGIYVPVKGFENLEQHVPFMDSDFSPKPNESDLEAIQSIVY